MLRTGENLTFIQEQGDGHFKDRLYVYWDVTTRCNFKCSYCYARAKYVPNDEWMRTDSDVRQNLVLAAIKKSTLPVYLGFHGGEPTLHHDFSGLVDRTLDALHRDDDSLYIATNGSNRNILNLPKHHKLRVMLSFHPEYGDPDKFLSVVKQCSDRYKTKVNVLLSTDKHHWNNIHKVYNIASQYGIPVHPHFIYDNTPQGEILHKYSDEFYAEFAYMKRSKCFYEMTDTNNTVHHISDVEMFELNLNQFKGWACYNNNYEILWNSVIHKICSDEFIDIAKNPLFFYNLKTIKPMICPFEKCLSDGVLKCLKHKSLSQS